MAWAGQVLFSIGLLWILSSLNVYFRDLQNMVSVAILFLMMTSPIAYTADMVPAALQPFLKLNPLYYLITCYQDCLMIGQFPARRRALGLAGDCGGLFLRRLLVFRTHEDPLRGQYLTCTPDEYCNDQDWAVSLTSLSKMYRLYRRPADRVLDALGVNRWLFWRKNYYQEFWAVRNLDLQIRRGERIGIIGRNGAGKSTLLKLICGNLAPTRRFRPGRRPHPGPDGTGDRVSIRSSPAGRISTPRWPTRALRSHRIRGKEAEIVDFAELEGFIDQPLKTYSAGMYTRLAFSTATAIEPDILIIDEVLGAGDAYFAGKCFERMRQITDRLGATVLFVSHDLASVQQLCCRVLWLERGRVLMDGSPLDVTKAYYASVLQQEEGRLKEANQRLARRHCGAGPGAAALPAASGSAAAVPDPADNRADGAASLSSEADAAKAQTDGRKGNSAAPALVIRDRWGTPQATFREIVPIDRWGQVNHVFQQGEDFGFRIVADIHQQLASCWMVVVLYDTKGNLIVTWKQRIGGGVGGRPEGLAGHGLPSAAAAG